MSVIQIYQQLSDDDQQERGLFLIENTDRQWIRYGLVIRGYGVTHTCGYLNLPKMDWLRVAGDVRRHSGISFEGIESDAISVPVKFMQSVPVEVCDYWIGIDYMGRKTPVPATVAEELKHILFQVSMYL